jgi:hypothetical protein
MLARYQSTAPSQTAQDHLAAISSKETPFNRQLRLLQTQHGYAITIMEV